MTDVVDVATRSRMMAGIKGKNTRPELILRRALHARGIRFRLHTTKLPGRPDIVFPRFGAVCFVHGCFWHRHEDCRFATTPGTREEFWQSKFVSTVDRDRRKQGELMIAGWRVAVVWECALRAGAVDTAAAGLADWLRGTSSHLEVGGN
ncbi:DNA mismatch endonuclease Vsr [Mesorhizobium sp.]|uniref:very short patch repair endonuclease n=1 Tax=Mesorhizobium sp. TaxID=1871066 RepID=UPI000FE56620|nr:DNA mismatch endonuclease Vsr [Mesorhizobium sp.]RWN64210.1 MAG: DNA mismatch endonuclease Vsr [Mesorhizobium sp.]